MIAQPRRCLLIIDSLLDYMTSRVRPTGSIEGLPPDQDLVQMGLSLASCKAILGPRYDQVRKTERPSFWAQEIIRVNWNTLLLLKAQLKAAARRSQVEKKAKMQGTGGLVLENAQSEEPAAPSHTATTVQKILDAISSDRNSPPAYVSLMSSAPGRFARALRSVSIHSRCRYGELDGRKWRSL